MFRYLIKLSFDGTNYHGWQMQDNANTVQAEVEKALTILLASKVEITGCGRTDAGVHAREYFAHFDLEKIIGEEMLSEIVYRLNAILPDDISVSDVFPVGNNLHARFSAFSRTYRYYVSTQKDPFNKIYSWTVYSKLEMQKMNDAAATLFDYIDYTSFSKLHTDVKTNNCRIMHAKWTKKDGMLIFTIVADRFLRNMVRAIVGTLLDVGKGNLSVDDFRKIIESRNRCDAGFSVPAKGLFLEKVEYKWNADDADLI